MTTTEISNKIKLFRRLPLLIKTALSEEANIESIAKKLSNVSTCLFIGRGQSFPIALEGALKLKEIAYIHAEGYAGGELKHGPIALIEDKSLVVAITPYADQFDKMLSNIEEVRSRGGLVLGVGPQKDTQFQKICSYTLSCPQIEEPTLQAILSVIPLQLFSYHTAVYKGTDVDQPRNLAKSVTVE